ncbi:MAG: TetR/AcrR family transcriptional regulator C-terminal domain-containing protein [Pseudochelatococcus sp.]|jgi:TetR/AcrR family tetracycline transcriptional repressor|uniref:TetR/AcrR family transcriptional regulator C-terminal domain-containing protein n=1 Tax=Pseudochelatococcus sp. TaxID=2020869 RepID=UPI003D935EC4
MNERTKAIGTRRTRRKMEKLTQAQIVAVGLRLVDEGGLDSLTMRALSDALDVQPPVLYRYFSDKRNLVDAMAEAIIGDIDLAGLPEDEPLEGLRELVRRLRQALLRHRDGARIVGGSYDAKSNTLKTAEVMMRLLIQAGFAKEKAIWTMTSLFSFALGEALEQQGLPERLRDALPPFMDAIEGVLAQPTYRHLDAAVLAQSFFDFEGRFEFGLTLILNGAKTVCPDCP